MVNNEVQQRTMTNQTKAIYSFTLYWILYQFTFFLISLCLPWSTDGNFFETVLSQFPDRPVTPFTYFALILFFMSLIFIIISFLIEKKLFLNKFKSLKIVFSFPIVWMLWYLGWLTMTFPLVFLGFGGSPSITGIGYTLFGYTSFGWIETPIFLQAFSGFFLIFLLIFPWFILIRVENIRKQPDIKERKVKKHSINKYIQILGWVGSIILTLGILICTIVSFFLPWSLYDNFITFLIAQFNQNSGLFISLIIGLIIIIINAILIVLSIFSVKPWKKSNRNKNQNNRDPLPNNKFNR